MRFALLISAAFHGLILVSLIGIQFEGQQIEEEKKISGPEVISFEEYCDLSSVNCEEPENSIAIELMSENFNTIKEETKSDFDVRDNEVLNPDLASLPSTLLEPTNKDRKPLFEMVEPEELDNQENETISDFKSEGNEIKTDIITLSHEKPPPRNSQRITEVASDDTSQESDVNVQNISTTFSEDAKLVAEEEEGRSRDESSSEISVEGESVEAVLSAAPKMAFLPPVRPKNITDMTDDEESYVSYGDLVNEALDQIADPDDQPSINEINNASDNYTLYKVEEGVRSFYNTAVLSGLAEPEKYKVRVKFFVNSEGVRKNSITLLEPKNPSDRHMISFKAAKNAIIKALTDKTNYISREKYPSGINIILNFTPSLGVGYD